MNKIDKKGAVITILLVIFQPICYFFAKIVQGNPTLIGNNIDTQIPFIIIFIIPYVLWYLLLFIIPYYLYVKDKETFKKYTISYILCILISIIIFIIYPTTVNRPEIIGTDILSIITKIVFFCDTPQVNCFPSIHCEISMLFILYILNCNNTKKDIKLLTIIISILIMLSTLFIKQHVFIDLIGGTLLAIITYLITKIISKKISTN